MPGPGQAGNSRSLSPVHSADGPPPIVSDHPLAGLTAADPGRATIAPADGGARSRGCASGGGSVGGGGAGGGASGLAAGSTGAGAASTDGAAAAGTTRALT